jgi:hypothetical protein
LWTGPQDRAADGKFYAKREPRNHEAPPDTA